MVPRLWLENIATRLNSRRGTKIMSDIKTTFTKDNSKYNKYEIGRYTYGEPLVLEWGEETK